MIKWLVYFYLNPGIAFIFWEEIKPHYSLGLQRVGHNWATETELNFYIYYLKCFQVGECKSKGEQLDMCVFMLRFLIFVTTGVVIADKFGCILLSLTDS